MTKEPSAPERVQAAYHQLSTAATGLNSASDELGKTIAELDAVLKQLNLGVSAWVVITSNSGDDGSYWSRSIGYSRVGNDWGITLKEITGHENWPADEVDIWLFNDAPRWMRIEGVGKIPEVLERLIRLADETTELIKKKTAEAKELTAAIKAAAAESKATMPLSSLAGPLSGAITPGAISPLTGAAIKARK